MGKLFNRGSLAPYKLSLKIGNIKPSLAFFLDFHYYFYLYLIKRHITKINKL